MKNNNNGRGRASDSASVSGYLDAAGQRWVLVKHEGRETVVPYSAFGPDGRLWPILSARRFDFVNPAARASLREEVAALKKFTRRVVFARPGWSEGQFATAAGKVISPPGVEDGLVAFTPHANKCSANGNQNRWKKRVCQPLLGHPIPCFFIMVPFAAPLLELVGRSDNFGFEIAGAGGKGKSLTQRLMASTCGPVMEKDRGYISTFYMTPAGLEKSMERHSDGTFVIDEANLFGSGSSGAADRRMMRDFSFQMSSGTTKGRYDCIDQEGYRFIYVTSANEPFNVLLGDAHRDVANAASDRLLSIVVPEGDAGVFGPLPDGYETYREFTLELEKAMALEYGTAMPRYLRSLVNARQEGAERLTKHIRKLIEKFKRMVGVNPNNGSDVRVGEAFGLAYAAGVLARKWRVIPAEFDCLGAAVHCYANFRSSVPGRKTLGERVEDVVTLPQTRTIDHKDLQTMSDEEMEATGAFVRFVKGEPILLMTPSFGRKLFPDWHALQGTAEFAALNKADKDARGRGYHCRVRANSKGDWFYAFRLPSDAIEA